MGPATQVESPESGSGDEGRMLVTPVSKADAQMSVSPHSFGDPQSPFSSLTFMLNLITAEDLSTIRKTELKWGLSKGSQLILLFRRMPSVTTMRTNTKNRKGHKVPTTERESRFTDSGGISHRITWLSFSED